MSISRTQQTLPPQARVLVVDDHTVLRDGLAALINAQSDMEVVCTASDGASAIQAINDTNPNVVIMDISMPVSNGMHGTAQIQKLDNAPHVIVLTRHTESAYVHQLLQAGARGYVLKQSPADELIRAIRTIMAGGTYLDPMLTDKAIDYFVTTHARNSVPTEPDLSQRETDVVRLTAHGFSNKEIAQQMGLSVKTVDTYKARAMEKLELHSRAALVRYALERGWFDRS